MIRLTRRSFAGALALSVFPPLAARARAQQASPVPGTGYAHPEWMIDGAALRGLLGANPAAKVIALTPSADFTAGHIRGAAQIDYPALEIVETADQRVATWRHEIEGVLTGLGITPADTVVIYDGGTFYGARLWWILDQLGHADKRMLNGGMGSWTAAGGALATGPFTPAPATTPYAGSPNEDGIATITEVEAALGDPNTVLVDARSAEEYAKGHIPGAINVDFRTNARPDDTTTWKSAADLLAMYADAGVTPEKRVIPYCTTGVRSAVTYLTLRLIGYDAVSLFTGSFKEWSGDPARPVTSGIAP